MKLEVNVESYGKVTLTDKEFIGSGGEALVYAKDNLAYKIYHEVSKMIPVDKIEELKKISASNVLKPQAVIRKQNTPIGYVMSYQKSTHPVCKLFTKAFRNQNSINNECIIDLVKKIQETIADIHRDKCLIVDLNEMNVLISARFKTPYFIDVDSYQTPSYKATAIMDSVRDRLVKNNQFTELSDWFSFAILAFQLYIGIHPYQGKHPDYKPNEWIKRMNDGISVFDKEVSIPKVCNDFNVIPSAHLKWFKQVFIKNERSIPPFADVVIAPVQVSIQKIEATKDFQTKLIYKYDENIFSAFNFMGVNYLIGATKAYKEDKVLPIEIKDARHAKFCESNDMSPIICELDEELLVCKDLSGKTISSATSQGFMYRNGAIYSVCNDKLMEYTFVKINSTAICKSREACSVLGNATQVFDGVIFQNLLGKCFVSLPYEIGKCLVKAVPELNGYRILEAKSERNICAVLAEKKGKYDRFIFSFDKSFSSYQIRASYDVSYSAINFTVLPNYICVMALDSTVEVFKDNQVTVISNPPFDTNTKLFSHSGNVYFIDKDSVYSAKTRK